MASRLRQKTTKSDRYEPAPRYYHQTVVIGGNLYMWAGSVDGLPRVHDSPEKRAFASLVDVFHLESGDWVQQLTSGTPPLGVYGYACAAVGDEVHYFGGDCGHRYCYHNSVHKLSTSSLQWVMLSPTISESDTPMKKAYCGMVAFCDGKEDILFVVGGGGTTPSSHQPGAQYEKLTDVRTISNEQHMFTLSTRKWSSPDINGEPPPPCDVFTLTPVSARRAALFGGDRGLEISPVSDLFIVDLSRHTVHWTKISKPCTGLSTIFRSLKWPEERYGHAATCVNGTLLVIMGGEINWKTMISDCWIYDITATLWKKLPLPDSVTKRRYHSLSTLQLSPQTVWLIVFGGQRSYGADPMFHTTTVELFQGRDGQWRVGKVMEGADLVRQYLQILSEGRRRGLSEENKSSVEHQLHQRVHQLEEEKRQIQQQQQQTRVRAAHEMEQVTTELLREKEQIQPQLETRTEKEQLRTESQLQTANTRADEEIRQLQLQVQQQQQQARVRASEMEQVTREKEQIQLQLNTRAEDLQLLKTEKEQLRTENKQLQTANTRADEQIRQLQLQVQQQQRQARVRASEMEQVMREKEQIQQELQTANTRRIQSQQQIRQLQQQVSDIIVQVS